MTTNKNDDDDIVLMYKAYQEQREVITLATYKAIRESAREYLQAQREEEAIERIKHVAESKYINAVDHQHQPVSHWFDKLKDTLLSLSPKAWVLPVAATAAILIALVSIIPITTNTLDDYGYNLTILSEEHDLMEDEIQSLQEWQYGFGSVEKPAISAFTTGTLLVDLLVIDTETDSELSNQLKAELLARAQKTGDTDTVSLLSDSDQTDFSIEELKSTVNLHYSDNPDSIYFELGQWIEYHYLLLKLAIERDNASLFLNARESKQKSDLIIDKLTQITNLTDNDIQRLRELLEQPSIDINSIQELSTLLLKIRTIVKSG